MAGPKKYPAGMELWPKKAVGLSVQEVVKTYEDGFVGAYSEPEEADKFDDLVKSYGGTIDGGQIAEQMGWAESGKGLLSIPFVYTMLQLPGVWPGAGQDVGDCFLGGTIILGEQTKPIDKVEIGDLVYTQDGSLTKVITRKAKTTLKPIVKIQAMGTMPVSVTCDHKVLIYRMGMNCLNYRNNRALAERDIKAFDQRKTKKPRDVETKCKTTAVLAYENRKEEWVKAEDVRNGDYLLSPLSREKTKQPDHPLLETPEGKWLIGYFLGDGSSGKRSIEFTIANKNHRFADKLQKTLEAAGFKSSRNSCGKKTKQPKAFRIRCHNTKLAKWFSQFYGQDKNKELPIWAIGDHDVIEGLLDADGHKKGRLQYFDSVSPSLVYGVQASFIEWGIDATVSKFHRSKGSYKTNKIAYRVIARKDKQKHYIWRDEKFVCFPVVECEIKEGPHTVYDIGVEHESHALLTNGTLFSNCVSHDERNANMQSYALEIWTNKPDEQTGKYEEMPKIPLKGIQQGAFSTEAFYWFRRHSGHGWSCEAAAQVAMKEGGLVTRDNHPELDIDLTTYSGEKASKYGRTPPSGKIAEALDNNLIRQATRLKGREQRRDYTTNGYGISTCGSEGFDNKRDENGFSKRKGSWGHAIGMGLGFDDRESTKQLYDGESLELMLNSWSIWNSGPRDIRDSKSYVPDLIEQIIQRLSKTKEEVEKLLLFTDLINPLTGNIMIPKGSFWVRSKDVDQRVFIAKGGVNGWPRKSISLGFEGNV